ncbi:DUF2264 domain-containing protein [Enterovibrio coralii]|uniref:DUF2264 domain-containing protein n=1 Tax=Enterovibrio coralii TaxID=294935 RepID=A0A135I7V6_9GAMM|nr:DUF2264 domain-containing protein [Enterovibrio coralii]KXF81540.1 hypothetical protein ATN88_02270 [Enterovibrio coralii]
MYAFNQFASEATFTHRDETVSVLAALIGQHMKAFLPESASLSDVPTRAHFDDKAQNLEGVARLLWAAVPLASEQPDILVSLRNAVENGVNPSHPAYWGEVTDYNQRCVEMSAIALAIVDQEALFFRAMPEEAQANTVRWLQAASYIQIPNNNWHFFRVLILMALRHIGVDFDAEVLKNDLKEIDDMYLAEGWYRDGRSGCTDYYNPFAFHYYGLVFARWVNGVVDRHTSVLSEFAQLFIHRAALFAKCFSLWVGSNGASVAYGRSMTYRFASAGVWSELACYSEALKNVGMSVADMKTLWVNHIRWWSQQPIISDGLLSVGYRYPNLIMSEIYNSPMSPLLALKGFAAVRLSATHPFWQEKENKMLENDGMQLLEKNRQIITRHRGTSFLLSGAPSAAELRNSHDKYLKFAYSSAHGFSVEAVRWIEQGFIGDNVMACKHPVTGEWKFRTALIKSELVENTLVTSWSPFDGCDVTTKQWMEGGKEWRLHQVEAETAFDFIMSGYAVDKWVKCIGARESRPSARISGSEIVSEMQLHEGQGGYDVMPCAPNTNLSFAQAAVPIIYGSVPQGSSRWLVSIISEKQ